MARQAGDMARAAERGDELDQGVDHGRSRMRRFRDRNTNPPEPELRDEAVGGGVTADLRGGWTWWRGEVV